jgi:phenylalanyl-tRNA synthetase beta chain
LKDEIFDIEVTTNRPDTMCVAGLAREASAILKAPFTPPEIKPIKSKEDNPLKVKILAGDLCRRYQAVVIGGAKVKESPWWLKQRLVSAGMRPVNNVVDITNYVLREMGQPLHAFDHEKIEGKKIIVRYAKDGEMMRALDGNKYKLTEEMLVIADARKPIAIAGVMGGEETSVTEKTTTIVLESATFDPVSIRRTARALNLYSDSSSLFEKGLSPEATSAALIRAVNLITQIAGGAVKSRIFDERIEPRKTLTMKMSVSRANNLIGIELRADEMKDILGRLGFSVSLSGDEIKAKVPYWREGDMEIEEDLVEEIARVYGYHRLPSILPTGILSVGELAPIVKWEKTAKDLALAFGYDEVLPYTMIGGAIQRNLGEDRAIRLANPLSADMEYMRTCLLPGLLRTAAENEKNFSSAKIFEIGRVYLPQKGDLPEQPLHFAGLNWGKSGSGELFYAAKGFALGLLEKFGIMNFKIRNSEDEIFHPARSGDLYADRKYIGSFGEMHPATVEKFGTDSRIGFFYFYFDELAKIAGSRKSYSPIPEYPGVKRDISFVVAARVEYEEIRKALIAADPLVAEVVFFDVYEGKGVGAGKKSIALHILFRSPNRTLETSEADRAWDKIVVALKEKFGAEMRM